MRSPTCLGLETVKSPESVANTYNNTTRCADYIAAAELLGQVGRVLLTVGAHKNVAEGGVLILVLLLRSTHHGRHLGRNLCVVYGFYRGVVDTFVQHLSIGRRLGRGCLIGRFGRWKRFGDLGRSQRLASEFAKLR